MKKTITANISGIVFHIESDAYDKLNRYLSTIRSYFDNSEEVDEIISDIESRIAELFREMLKDEREVVTMHDVDKVIGIMGEPEQFVEADSEYDSSQEKHRKGSFNRKLFRDPDDKVLGGVCSGIGHYFGVESMWIRLTFLIAFFAFGVGLIPYLILWIVMPLAKTASDKLKMKGEPVTADSIGRTIRDEYGRIKKKVNSGKYNTAADKVEQFFTFLAGVLVYIFKFLVKLIALVVILATVFILLFMSIGFFVGPDNFNLEINNVEYLLQAELIELVLDNKLLYYLVSSSLVALIAVPLLAILYAGIKLLFNFKSGNKAIGLSLGMIWILGILILIASAFVVADKFSSRFSDTNTAELKNFSSDTLYLASHIPEEVGLGGFEDDFESAPIFMKDDKVYMKSFTVDVVPSNTSNFKLKVKKKSFGGDNKTAKNNVKNISYSYRIEDSLLSINQYLSFPSSNGFRDQEMKISIGVPMNKVIFFSQSSKSIIYDVGNTTDTWDYEMVGHYWKMTGKGLECLDCEWNIVDEESTIEEDTL